MTLEEMTNREIVNEYRTAVIDAATIGGGRARSWEDKVEQELFKRLDIQEDNK